MASEGSRGHSSRVYRRACEGRPTRHCCVDDALPGRHRMRRPSKHRHRDRGRPAGTSSGGALPESKPLPNMRIPLSDPTNPHLHREVQSQSDVDLAIGSGGGACTMSHPLVSTGLQLPFVETPPLVCATAVRAKGYPESRLP